MQRDYEVVLITASDLNNEEQSALLERMRGFVQRFEGEILIEYVWGRRKLAYPIKKKDYGVYHLWYLRGEGPMLEELDRQFNYAEGVIRAQIVRVEDAKIAAAKFEELTSIKPGAAVEEDTEEEATEDTETVEA